MTRSNIQPRPGARFIKKHDTVTSGLWTYPVMITLTLSRRLSSNLRLARVERKKYGRFKAEAGQCVTRRWYGSMSQAEQSTGDVGHLK